MPRAPCTAVCCAGRRGRLGAAVGAAAPDVAYTRGGLEATFINAAAAVLMRRKDPDEIELLRRSISAMEAAFAAARDGIRPGMTELQAYTFVTDIVMDRLGEQALVYGDFASGPRAEKKGGPPTPRRIEKGELFLLDYSTVLCGYRADFTNTWVVDGEPTPRQRELASFCLEAMRGGEKLLKPGSRGHDIDAALRRVFASHGVEDHSRTTAATASDSVIRTRRISPRAATMSSSKGTSSRSSRACMWTALVGCASSTTT